MVPINLSSKGQLTIPKKFRQRLQLTGRRRVTVEQLKDGTILIRPIRSILHLAGTIELKGPLLSPREERLAVEERLGKERGGEGRN